MPQKRIRKARREKEESMPVRRRAQALRESFVLGGVYGIETKQTGS